MPGRVVDPISATHRARATNAGCRPERSASRRGLFRNLCSLMLAAGFAAGVAAGGCGGPKKVVAPTVPVASAPEPDHPVVVDALSEETALLAAAPAGPLLVRVGLSNDADRLELTGNGAAYLLLGDGRRRETRLETGAPLTVKRRDGAVDWRTADRSGTASVVVLQPVDPDRQVIVPDPDRSGRTLTLRGEVAVFVGAGRGLTMVNVIELEAYLCGVVPWEIGRHGRDAVAALAAQAVAARTYTVAHLGTREAQGFDVWAGVADQVYRGAADEDPICNDAIAGTAGQVLIHAGEPIAAYYSATCGGVTSQIEEVWPRPPELYLVSHPDRPAGGGEPFCAGAKYFRWQESWTGKQLEAILARTLPRYVRYMTDGSRAEWAGRVFSPRRAGSSPDRPDKLLDLTIVRRTRSGRIAQLDVATAAGLYHVRGDRVRWVLEPASGRPAILRSARFELEVESGGGRVRRVTAEGGGYGHGVGLCQVGALQMARLGYGVEAILAHYYPGATLVPYAGRTDQR
jgi:stage II sporulation protein D